MKIFALVLFVPLALGACGSGPKFASDELRSLKTACVGGHFDVCANIGHKVRRAVAEQAYRAQFAQ